MRSLLFLLYLLIALSSSSILSCSCFTRLFTRIHRILWIRRSLETTFARAYLIQQCRDCEDSIVELRRALNRAVQTHDEASKILAHYQNKI